MRVSDWHIGPDSTVFRIDDATDRIVMLNDRIRTLTTQDSRRGTRDGAIIGGAVGGVLGLIVGAIATTMDPTYDCETGPEDPDYEWSLSLKVEDDNDGLDVLSGSRHRRGNRQCIRRTNRQSIRHNEIGGILP